LTELPSILEPISNLLQQLEKPAEGAEGLGQQSPSSEGCLMALQVPDHRIDRPPAYDMATPSFKKTAGQLL